MNAIFVIVSTVTFMLPSSHTMIAHRVAGAGMPHCRSYPIEGGEAPCLPKFAVRERKDVNGWSDSGYITFSSAAVKKLNHNEFALLAGHEIAHYYLRHRGNKISQEISADKLGAQLMCDAGYDLSDSLSLFRHLKQDVSHPSPKFRIYILSQIECKNIYNK